MVCAFNKAAKILTCIGFCLSIIGVLCYVIALGSAASGFDIETQGGSRSFTISMAGGDLGHGVYIAQSASCTSTDLFEIGNAATNDPLITYSNGDQSETLSIQCSPIGPDSEETFENSHDPPIRSVGTMGAISQNSNGQCTDTSHCPDSDSGDESCTGACNGIYQISCSTDCWVIDAGEELGEAVAGAVGALLLMVVMALLLGIGGILLCVACCCCCQGPDKPAGPPVQGMVVGQPVASA